MNVTCSFLSLMECIGMRRCNAMYEQQKWQQIEMLKSECRVKWVEFTQNYLIKFLNWIHSELIDDCDFIVLFVFRLLPPLPRSHVSPRRVCLGSKRMYVQLVVYAERQRIYAWWWIQGNCEGIKMRNYSFTHKTYCISERVNEKREKTFPRLPDGFKRISFNYFFNYKQFGVE